MPLLGSPKGIVFSTLHKSLNSCLAPDQRQLISTLTANISTNTAKCNKELPIFSTLVPMVLKNHHLLHYLLAIAYPAYKSAIDANFVAKIEELVLENVIVDSTADKDTVLSLPTLSKAQLQTLYNKLSPSNASQNPPMTRKQIGNIYRQFQQLIRTLPLYYEVAILDLLIHLDLVLNQIKSDHMQLFLLLSDQSLPIFAISDPVRAVIQPFVDILSPCIHLIPTDLLYIEHLVKIPSYFFTLIPFSARSTLSYVIQSQFTHFRLNFNLDATSPLLQLLERQQPPAELLAQQTASSKNGKGKEQSKPVQQTAPFPSIPSIPSIPPSSLHSKALNPSYAQTLRGKAENPAEYAKYLEAQTIPIFVQIFFNLFHQFPPAERLHHGAPSFETFLANYSVLQHNIDNFSLFKPSLQITHLRSNPPPGTAMDISDIEKLPDEPPEVPLWWQFDWSLQAKLFVSVLFACRRERFLPYYKKLLEFNGLGHFSVKSSAEVMFITSAPEILFNPSQSPQLLSYLPSLLLPPFELVQSYFNILSDSPTLTDEHIYAQIAQIPPNHHIALDFTEVPSLAVLPNVHELNFKGATTEEIIVQIHAECFNYFRKLPTHPHYNLSIDAFLHRWEYTRLTHAVDQAKAKRDENPTSRAFVNEYTAVFKEMSESCDINRIPSCYFTCNDLYIPADVTVDTNESDQFSKNINKNNNSISKNSNNKFEQVHAQYGNVLNHQYILDKYLSPLIESNSLIAASNPLIESSCNRSTLSCHSSTPQFITSLLALPSTVINYIQHNYHQFTPIPCQFRFIFPTLPLSAFSHVTFDSRLQPIHNQPSLSDSTLSKWFFNVFFNSDVKNLINFHFASHSTSTASSFIDSNPDCDLIAPKYNNDPFLSNRIESLIKTPQTRNESDLPSSQPPQFDMFTSSSCNSAEFQTNHLKPPHSTQIDSTTHSTTDSSTSTIQFHDPLLTAMLSCRVEVNESDIEGDLENLDPNLLSSPLPAKPFSNATSVQCGDMNDRNECQNSATLSPSPTPAISQPWQSQTTSTLLSIAQPTIESESESTSTFTATDKDKQRIDTLIARYNQRSTQPCWLFSTSVSSHNTSQDHLQDHQNIEIDDIIDHQDVEFDNTRSQHPLNLALSAQSLRYGVLYTKVPRANTSETIAVPSRFVTSDSKTGYFNQPPRHPLDTMSDDIRREQSCVAWCECCSECCCSSICCDGRCTEFELLNDAISNTDNDLANELAETAFASKTAIPLPPPSYDFSQRFQNNGSHANDRIAFNSISPRQPAAQWRPFDILSCIKSRNLHRYHYACRFDSTTGKRSCEVPPCQVNLYPNFHFPLLTSSSGSIVPFVHECFQEIASPSITPSSTASNRSLRFDSTTPFDPSSIHPGGYDVIIEDLPDDNNSDTHPTIELKQLVMKSDIAKLLDIDADPSPFAHMRDLLNAFSRNHVTTPQHLDQNPNIDEDDANSLDPLSNCSTSLSTTTKFDDLLYDVSTIERINDLSARYFDSLGITDRDHVAFLQSYWLPVFEPVDQSQENTNQFDLNSISDSQPHENQHLYYNSNTNQYYSSLDDIDETLYTGGYGDDNFDDDQNDQNSHNPNFNPHFANSTMSDSTDGPYSPPALATTTPNALYKMRKTTSPLYQMLHQQYLTDPSSYPRFPSARYLVTPHKVFQGIRNLTNDPSQIVPLQHPIKYHRNAAFLPSLTAKLSFSNPPRVSQGFSPQFIHDWYCEQLNPFAINPYFLPISAFDLLSNTSLPKPPSPEQPVAQRLVTTKYDEEIHNHYLHEFFTAKTLYDQHKFLGYSPVLSNTLHLTTKTASDPLIKAAFMMDIIHFPHNSIDCPRNKYKPLNSFEYLQTQFLPGVDMTKNDESHRLTTSSLTTNSSQQIDALRSEPTSTLAQDLNTPLLPPPQILKNDRDYHYCCSQLFSQLPSQLDPQIRRVERLNAKGDQIPFEQLYTSAVNAFGQDIWYKSLSLKQRTEEIIKRINEWREYDFETETQRLARRVYQWLHLRFVEFPFIDFTQCGKTAQNEDEYDQSPENQFKRAKLSKDNPLANANNPYVIAHSRILPLLPWVLDQQLIKINPVEQRNNSDAETTGNKGNENAIISNNGERSQESPNATPESRLQHYWNKSQTDDDEFQPHHSEQQYGFQYFSPMLNAEPIPNPNTKTPHHQPLSAKSLQSEKAQPSASTDDSDSTDGDDDDTAQFLYLYTQWKVHASSADISKLPCRETVFKTPPIDQTRPQTDLEQNAHNANARQSNDQREAQQKDKKPANALSSANLSPLPSCDLLLYRYLNNYASTDDNALLDQLHDDELQAKAKAPTGVYNQYKIQQYLDDQLVRRNFTQTDAMNYVYGDLRNPSNPETIIQCGRLFDPKLIYSSLPKYPIPFNGSIQRQLYPLHFSKADSLKNGKTVRTNDFMYNGEQLLSIDTESDDLIVHIPNHYHLNMAKSHGELTAEIHSINALSNKYPANHVHQRDQPECCQTNNTTSPNPNNHSTPIISDQTKSSLVTAAVLNSDNLPCADTSEFELKTPEFPPIRLTFRPEFIATQAESITPERKPVVSIDEWFEDEIYAIHANVYKRSFGNPYSPINTLSAPKQVLLDFANMIRQKLDNKSIARQRAAAIKKRCEEVKLWLPFLPHLHHNKLQLDPAYNGELDEKYQFEAYHAQETSFKCVFEKEEFEQVIYESIGLPHGYTTHPPAIGTNEHTAWVEEFIEKEEYKLGEYHHDQYAFWYWKYPPVDPYDYGLVLDPPDFYERLYRWYEQTLEVRAMNAEQPPHTPPGFLFSNIPTLFNITNEIDWELFLVEYNLCFPNVPEINDFLNTMREVNARLAPPKASEQQTLDSPHKTNKPTHIALGWNIFIEPVAQKHVHLYSSNPKDVLGFIVDNYGFQYGPTPIKIPLHLVHLNPNTGLYTLSDAKVPKQRADHGVNRLNYTKEEQFYHDTNLHYTTTEVPDQVLMHNNHHASGMDYQHEMLYLPNDFPFFENDSMWTDPLFFSPSAQATTPGSKESMSDFFNRPLFNTLYKHNLYDWTAFEQECDPENKFKQDTQAWYSKTYFYADYPWVRHNAELFGMHLAQSVEKSGLSVNYDHQLPPQLQTSAIDRGVISDYPHLNDANSATIGITPPSLHQRQDNLYDLSDALVRVEPLKAPMSTAVGPIPSSTISTSPTTDQLRQSTHQPAYTRETGNLVNKYVPKDYRKLTLDEIRQDFYLIPRKRFIIPFEAQVDQSLAPNSYEFNVAKMKYHQENYLLLKKPSLRQFTDHIYALVRSRALHPTIYIHDILVRKIQPQVHRVPTPLPPRPTFSGHHTAMKYHLSWDSKTNLFHSFEQRDELHIYPVCEHLQQRENWPHERLSPFKSHLHGCSYFDQTRWYDVSKKPLHTAVIPRFYGVAIPYDISHINTVTKYQHLMKHASFYNSLYHGGYCHYDGSRLHLQPIDPYLTHAARDTSATLDCTDVALEHYKWTSAYVNSTLAPFTHHQFEKSIPDPSTKDSYLHSPFRPFFIPSTGKFVLRQSVINYLENTLNPTINLTRMMLTGVDATSIQETIRNPAFRDYLQSTDLFSQLTQDRSAGNVSCSKPDTYARLIAHAAQYRKEFEMDKVRPQNRSKVAIIRSTWHGDDFNSDYARDGCDEDDCDEVDPIEAVSNDHRTTSADSSRAISKPQKQPTGNNASSKSSIMDDNVESYIFSSFQHTPLSFSDDLSDILHQPEQKCSPIWYNTVRTSLIHNLSRVGQQPLYIPHDHRDNAANLVLSTWSTGGNGSVIPKLPDWYHSFNHVTAPIAGNSGKVALLPSYHDLPHTFMPSHDKTSKANSKTNNVQSQQKINSLGSARSTTIESPFVPLHYNFDLFSTFDEQDLGLTHHLYRQMHRTSKQLSAQREAQRAASCWPDHWQIAPPPHNLSQTHTRKEFNRAAKKNQFMTVPSFFSPFDPISDEPLDHILNASWNELEDDNWIEKCFDGATLRDTTNLARTAFGTSDNATTDLLPGQQRPNAMNMDKNRSTADFDEEDGSNRFYDDSSDQEQPRVTDFSKLFQTDPLVITDLCPFQLDYDFTPYTLRASLQQDTTININQTYEEAYQNTAIYNQQPNYTFYSRTKLLPSFAPPPTDLNHLYTNTYYEFALDKEMYRDQLMTSDSFNESLFEAQFDVFFKPCAHNATFSLKPFHPVHKPQFKAFLAQWLDAGLFKCSPRQEFIDLLHHALKQPLPQHIHQDQNKSDENQIYCGNRKNQNDHTSATTITTPATTTINSVPLYSSQTAAQSQNIATILNHITSQQQQQQQQQQDELQHLASLIPTLDECIEADIHNIPRIKSTNLLQRAIYHPQLLPHFVNLRSSSSSLPRSALTFHPTCIATPRNPENIRPKSIPSPFQWLNHQNLDQQMYHGVVNPFDFITDEPGRINPSAANYPLYLHALNLHFTQSCKQFTEDWTSLSQLQSKTLQHQQHQQQQTSQYGYPTFNYFNLNNTNTNSNTNTTPKDSEKPPNKPHSTESKQKQFDEEELEWVNLLCTCFTQQQTLEELFDVLLPPGLPPVTIPFSSTGNEGYQWYEQFIDHIDYKFHDPNPIVMHLQEKLLLPTTLITPLPPQSAVPKGLAMYAAFTPQYNPLDIPHYLLDKTKYEQIIVSTFKPSPKPIPLHSPLDKLLRNDALHHFNEEVINWVAKLNEYIHFFILSECQWVQNELIHLHADLTTHQQHPSNTPLPPLSNDVYSNISTLLPLFTAINNILENNHSHALSATAKASTINIARMQSQKPRQPRQPHGNESRKKNLGPLSYTPTGERDFGPIARSNLELTKDPKVKKLLEDPLAADNICANCRKQLNEPTIESQRTQNLLKHIISCIGYTPFQCSQCCRRFSNSSNLKVHMVRHCFNTRPPV